MKFPSFSGDNVGKGRKLLILNDSGQLKNRQNTIEDKIVVKFIYDAYFF